MRGSLCVCVYLLNTSEILYPYLVFACVEACFAIASAFPTPLTYFSGIFTCCRRVVQRKLMPLVYMCECVCVSATVHLCIFLSCISARERFLCHCANYTKTTTTTTSGRTDNVCHHMQHSARSNPPLPPLLPSPFHRSTALDTHTTFVHLFLCGNCNLHELALKMSLARRCRGSGWPAVGVAPPTV